MLISEQAVSKPDALLALVSVLHGGGARPRELQTGVYQVGHFGSSHFLLGYEQYPDLSIECYGVCDSVEQLLQACPELTGDSSRKFVVTVTPVRRGEQPRDGGWRWREWGPYIGTQTPTTEYLHDEPEIEEVLVYHIYERKR